MTYIKILLFALFQFLLIAAIAQPAERWVRVEYTQRLKDHMVKNVNPELKALMQISPGVLIAGNGKSLYEETGPASGSAIKPPNKNIGSIPLKDQERQVNILPGTDFFQKPLRKIFKLFDTNLMATIHKVQNNLLRVEEQIKYIDWTILNEVAIIAGMTCRKASFVTPAGINIEAWFTEEIPIPDGPLSFHGLPGLILKVETHQFTVEASKISFIANQVIEKPVEGELVKKEELQQRMMAIINSPIDSESLKNEVIKGLHSVPNKN